METYEKLGAFYLGRVHDLQKNETLPETLLYDSKDLTTHAVCVGMTGSGKTGLRRSHRRSRNGWYSLSHHRSQGRYDQPDAHLS